MADTIIISINIIATQEFFKSVLADGFSTGV